MRLHLTRPWATAEHSYEEDFEYTWQWFQSLRKFWLRAAAEGRFVLFSVDQYLPVQPANEALHLAAAGGRAHRLVVVAHPPPQKSDPKEPT